jgi:hypothetical protein
MAARHASGRGGLISAEMHFRRRQVTPFYNWLYNDRIADPGIMNNSVPLKP